MQTNNIQLGLAVKPVVKNGGSTPASGLLGPSAAENGFSSWLQQSSGAAVTNGRSESKVLPQEGSESPVTDLRDNSASSQQSSNTEASDKVKISSESAEVASDDADPSPGADMAPDGVANATDAPVETEVAPDQSSEAVAQNPATESVAGADAEVTQEDLLDLDQTDAPPDSVAASTTATTEGRQTDALVQTGQVVDQADQLNQSNQASLNGSDTTDAEAPVANNGKAPDHAQAGGRINSDTPPPGIAHASPQGLAHGRAFQNGNVESAPDVATSQSDALVSGETVEVADTADTGVTSDQAEAAVGAPVLATDETGEADTSQDNETLIAGQLQPEVKETSVPATELDQSLPTPSSDAPKAPEQVAESDISQPLVAAETVPADESEAEVKAQATTIAPATDSEHLVEISPSLASAQPVTNTQPINAPSTGQAASGQSPGASLASPTGPAGQMTAQMTTEQLLQSASSKGVESTVKAEGPASATSTPTATPTATPATANPLADTGLKPQTALATAVPPQALNRMQQEQWGQRLGERALMMVQQGPRVAYVQLDPPELGALQVRVHLGQGDQVSLNFTVPNAAVRDVLEQHLPRLREMFAEQGLNLAQSDVRDQSAGGQDRGDGGTSRRGEQYAGNAEEPDLPFSELRVPVGMVDFYA